VDGTGTVGSKDIEASRPVPLAVQEGEDMMDTRKAGCIPFVGDRCTEVGHMMQAEVRIGMRRRTTEKQPESFGNFLRY
jgi:hypothetical protein